MSEIVFEKQVDNRKRLFSDQWHTWCQSLSALKLISSPDSSGVILLLCGLEHFCVCENHRGHPRVGLSLKTRMMQRARNLPSRWLEICFRGWSIISRGSRWNEGKKRLKWLPLWGNQKQNSLTKRQWMIIYDLLIPSAGERRCNKLPLLV